MTNLGIGLRNSNRKSEKRPNATRRPPFANWERAHAQAFHKHI
jgi:hypothetical protein